MIFCFDIDNTICTTKGKDYKSAKPKKNVINLINELYDSGHTIKILHQDIWAEIKRMQKS